MIKKMEGRLRLYNFSDQKYLEAAADTKNPYDLGLPVLMPYLTLDPISSNFQGIRYLGSCQIVGTNRFPTAHIKQALAQHHVSTVVL